MTYYPDSSFLVSCYVLDANIPAAKSYLARIRAPLVFTALHLVEVRNALKLGIFRGLFTDAESVGAWANLQTDLRNGRLTKSPVKWALALRVAGRLSERHSASIGTRSLDILHVATAMTLRTREFVTFDGRQLALANKVNLRVAP